nr:probable diacyglycerol O-acyltransferase tgs1 [Procambarus clarkii]
MMTWNGWWLCVAAVSQCVVGLIIVMVAVPLVVPVLAVLWVWRCVVMMVVQGIHGGGVYAASGMDALFALDSTGARAAICGVAVLRGQVSVATVRNRLAARITEVQDTRGRFVHAKFRQVVEKRCGVVVWLPETNFHINNHVRELHQRLLDDEDDMLREMSARVNLPFVPGQSKWEVLVAPLRNPATDKCCEWTHTAVIVRFHHTLGDGRSVMRLISTLVDPPPSDILPHPATSSCSRASRAAHLLWSLTHVPWVLLRLLKRTDASALHGPRLSGTKFLVWSPPLSLAALKTGRALAGVSVNDLLLAGLAAALCRYFTEEAREVHPQVITVVPVDLTPPGTPLVLTNHFSLCTVPLPTCAMSKRSRLMTVHRRLEVLKHSPDVMVNFLVLDLVANLLPAPLARRALATHGVTMVASNMPGPSNQIQMFGEVVEDLMFWIPNKSRTGLGVSMLSYRGSVRLGLNVDSALIPSKTLASQLMEHTTAEVSAILAELANSEIKSEEIHLPEGGESYSSISIGGISEVVATHSTDEYDDDGAGVGSFSYFEMRGSSDRRTIDNSVTSFENEVLCPSEDQYLLGRVSRSSASRSPRSDLELEKAFHEIKRHKFELSDIHLEISDDNQIEDR